MKDEIYSLGGATDDLILSKCEKYSIALNKWTSLPNLHTGRCDCAAFSFNDAQIFCVGGCNKNLLNSMEKLNLLKPSKWSYVKIKNVFSERIAIHAFQISNNEVIVFGGESNECFLLKIDDGIVCKKIVNLATSCECEFVCTASPVCYGKHIYGIDNKNNKIAGTKAATIINL